jgi:3-phenylpropionate/trans-cinnamate dioxygenase ferredoxin reductase subunit
MGREFVRELSVALGFVGIAMMALQFVVTARISTITLPYGSDVVYHFHHYMSLVVLGLWLAHPLILFVRFPRTQALLNPITAPWRARAGLSSVVAIIALVIISVWRKRLKVEYDRWRIWHGILAVLALILVMTHAFMVGKYIGTPVKRSLWLGYGVVWVLVVLYVRVIRPLRIAHRPYEVVDIRPEVGNVWALAVKPVGHAGMRFMPGQFAWLTAWKSPVAHVEHAFSFSSSAERTELLEFGIKELGDFTSTIHELQPDQRVYLEGPFGAFSVDRYPDAQAYAFIAGGIGVTPVMSMLRTLADRGDRRPLLLIYGNREWEEVAFRKELEGLQERLNLKIIHVLERPPEDWEDEVGFVTREMLDRYLSPEERRVTDIFLCGPPPMMDAVIEALLELDIHPKQIHFERFDLA